MLLRCQTLLAGLLFLYAAGLGGQNILSKTEESNPTVPGSPNKTATITITLAPTTNDSQSAATTAVPVNGATLNSPQPNTTSNALPSTDYEPTSTATPLNSSKEAASTTGAPTTAVTTNTTTVSTSQESQTATVNNSTVISSSSNSTAPISTPASSTDAHIHSNISSSPGAPSASPTPTMGNSPNGTLSAGTDGSTQSPNATATEPGSSETPTATKGTPGRVDELPAATSPKEPSQTDSIIMKEAPAALSSGSIAAITVTVIIFVLLVFGGAAYLKIRHSSYGRLVDDHDYGSWGNYNNPLYDDS